MSTLADRERFRRDHRWAPGRMSDYLDGELAPARRARMERHLGECAKCRQLLAGLRATVAALHRLTGPEDGVDPIAVATTVRGRLSKPG
jgi:anti-sigma factor RsiW